MSDLSSVAREAADRYCADIHPEHLAFQHGFTECASRIPSEEEIYRAMWEAEPRSSIPFGEEPEHVRETGLLLARAVHKLITRKLEEKQ